MVEENSNKILDNLKLADEILSGEKNFKDKKAKARKIKEIRNDLDYTKFYTGSFREIGFGRRGIRPHFNNNLFFLISLFVVIPLIISSFVFLSGIEFGGLNIERSLVLSFILNLLGLVILFGLLSSMSSKKYFKYTLDYFPIENVDEFVLENLGRDISEELKELEEELKDDIIIDE